VHFKTKPLYYHFSYYLTVSIFDIICNYYPTIFFVHSNNFIKATEMIFTEEDLRFLYLIIDYGLRRVMREFPGKRNSFDWTTYHEAA